MAFRTVLVVEDSEIEGQMLERGLRNTISQSAVVLVNTTTEAERYLFPNETESSSKPPNPDLVVLDVKVPPAGGVDFLKRVRSDERTKNIPVVMMSGKLRDQDVQDLYRSGANSYIDKPVDFQEFVSVIAAASRYWLGLNLNSKQGR